MPIDRKPEDLVRRMAEFAGELKCLAVDEPDQANGWRWPGILSTVCDGRPVGALTERGRCEGGDQAEAAGSRRATSLWKVASKSGSYCSG